MRSPAMSTIRASVRGGALAKAAGSSANPFTPTSCPARIQRDIWSKNVNGTGPNSIFSQSWVASFRRACDHSVGLPTP